MRSKVVLGLLKLALVLGATRSAIANDQIEQKIGKYSPEKVEAFIKSRIQLVQSQFEPQYDPYAGYDSVPEKCQLKNLPKPVMKSGKDFQYALMSVYSSKGKVIGECSDQENLLKLQYLILYCKKSQEMLLYKSFYSQKSEWKTQPVAQCP